MSELSDKFPCCMLSDFLKTTNLLVKLINDLKLSGLVLFANADCLSAFHFIEICLYSDGSASLFVKFIESRTSG